MTEERWLKIKLEEDSQYGEIIQGYFDLQQKNRSGRRTLLTRLEITNNPPTGEKNDPIFETDYWKQQVKKAETNLNG